MKVFWKVASFAWKNDVKLIWQTHKLFLAMRLFWVIYDHCAGALTWKCKPDANLEKHCQIVITGSCCCSSSIVKSGALRANSLWILNSEVVIKMLMPGFDHRIPTGEEAYTKRSWWVAYIKRGRKKLDCWMKCSTLGQNCIFCQIIFFLNFAILAWKFKFPFGIDKINLDFFDKNWTFCPSVWSRGRIE